MEKNKRTKYCPKMNYSEAFLLPFSIPLVKSIRFKLTAAVEFILYGLTLS